VVVVGQERVYRALRKSRQGRSRYRKTDTWYFCKVLDGTTLEKNE
jgi:hypothetical protein